MTDSTAAMLSPSFSLAELTRSEEATRRGISNALAPEHLANLQTLALGLEMVRLVLKRPLIITSGYRSAELNRVIGGTLTSSHLTGFAADFYCAGADMAAIGRTLVGALPFDQLIYESSRGVLHLSFDMRLRGQVFTQKGGPNTPKVKGIQS